MLLRVINFVSPSAGRSRILSQLSCINQINYLVLLLSFKRFTLLVFAYRINKPTSYLSNYFIESAKTLTRFTRYFVCLVKGFDLVATGSIDKKC